MGVKRVLAGACVVAIALGGMARAQAIDPILVRQGGFDLMGAVAANMKRGVDSGAEVKPFADDAAALANWGTIIPTLFPPGSETGHDTKAKPDIWSDRAGFDKAAADFSAAAKKLADAAKSNDKAAFADAFKATGGACGACHKTFRARTN